MDTLLNILALVIIFGLLVSIHEIGHLLAAKRAGVKVEEFAFGFGPQIAQKSFRGTVYKINILPLGGFVKLKGEQAYEKDALSKDPDIYYNKPLKSKLFILSAGVIMNFVLACGLFMIYLPAINYQVSFQKIGDFPFIGTENTTILPPSLFVAGVEAGSPADGKLKVGDIIIGLNDGGFESDTQYLAFLDANAGKPITLKLFLLDSQTTTDVSVILREKDGDNTLLGISTSSDQHSYYLINYYPNVASGIVHAFNMFLYQIYVIGHLIAQSIAQANIQPLASQVGGVVAVADAVSQVITIKEFTALLNITALISLSLAFVNFLPIPLIDGGQATIEVFEKLRGKKISAITMERISFASLLVIIALFVLVTLKDVSQIHLLDSINSLIKGVLGR